MGRRTDYQSIIEEVREDIMCIMNYYQELNPIKNEIFSMIDLGSVVIPKAERKSDVNDVIKKVGYIRSMRMYAQIQKLATQHTVKWKIGHDHFRHIAQFSKNDQNERFTIPSIEGGAQKACSPMEQYEQSLEEMTQSAEDLD